MTDADDQRPEAVVVKQRKPLSPRRTLFVAAYLQHSNGTQAAIEAGYSRRNASHVACDLLKRPEVREAIDQVRARVMAESQYDLCRAMKEAEEAMEFARTTKNAMALAKMVEHRAKLNGLLIDRVDLTSGGLDLASALEEAKTRYVKLSGPVLDADFEEVPSGTLPEPSTKPQPSIFD